jgi:hypothetical protein
MSALRKLWPLRKRSDHGDHVGHVSGTAYPGINSYVSGHKDAPLTPRARALWWLAGGLIVAGGIAVLIVSAR